MPGGTSVLRRLLPSCALALGLAGAAGAQGVIDEVQDLSFDAPESWAMKYFTSVSLLTGLGVAEAREPGSVEVGVEASSVPRLSAAERTVGFGGTKTEDLNRTEVFARPRLLVGLPGRFTAEASYVPPIDISGVEPELWAVALGRPLAGGARARFGARLIFQHGTFEGDFTCSRDEIESGPNPFDCERPSNDVMDLDTLSLELTGALELGRDGRWRPYLTVAGHRMDLEFQVDSRYAGLVDRTLLLTEGDTVSFAGGVDRRLGTRGRLAAELLWAPLDVVRPPSTTSESDDLLHLRVGYRYRLR